MAVCNKSDRAFLLYDVGLLFFLHVFFLSLCFFIYTVISADFLHTRKTFQVKSPAVKFFFLTIRELVGIISRRSVSRNLTILFVCWLSAGLGISRISSMRFADESESPTPSLSSLHSSSLSSASSTTSTSSSLDHNNRGHQLLLLEAPSSKRGNFHLTAQFFVIVDGHNWANYRI
jgi:hypothetical protein